MIGTIVIPMLKIPMPATCMVAMISAVLHYYYVGNNTKNAGDGM